MTFYKYKNQILEPLYNIEYLEALGAREKYIVTDDKDDIYVFKLPKERVKHELWSEVIASYYGKLLGINVVDYTVGIFEKEGKVELASLCPIVTDEYTELTHCFELIDKEDISIKDSNELLEKINFVNNIYNNYIEDMCIDYWRNYIKGDIFVDFYTMLIFDYLIGNTDRHSENWGFLVSGAQGIHHIDLILFNLNDDSIIDCIKEDYISIILAPLFDLSTSLGSGIMDNDLVIRLKDKNYVNIYIEKGKSNILLDDKKVSLFEILKSIKILDKERFDLVLSKIVSKFVSVNKDIETFVYNVDKEFETFTEYKLIDERKRFILDNIFLRQEKLKELL